MWPADEATFGLGVQADHGAVSVRGIGQKAYVSRGATPHLLVWTNGIALRFDVASGSDSVKVEEALAKLAVPRATSG